MPFRKYELVDTLRSLRTFALILYLCLPLPVHGGCPESLAKLAPPFETLEGKSIITWLGERFDLKDLYSAGTGVWEGYDLATHTSMVLDRFRLIEKNFDLAGISKRNQLDVRHFFGALLALHDIGKPLAVKAGNRFRQHEFTRPLLSRILPELGFSAKQVKLSLALVDNDILGDYVRGKKAILPTLVALQSLSHETGMTVDDYLALQELLYLSDATSYPAVANYFHDDDHGKPTDNRGFLEYLHRRLSPPPPQSPEDGGDFSTPEQIARFQTLDGKLGERLREPWAPASFSDPTHHQKDSFTYIVHGAKEPEMLLPLLSDDPPSDFPGISLSLISQDRTNTWSPAGIIVKVPKENIFASSSEDMRSSTLRSPVPSEILKGLQSNFWVNGLASPAEVLAKAKPLTTGLDHTEVFAVGTSPTGQKLEVTGLFYKVDSRGTSYLNGEQMAEMRRMAETKHLPLVPIGPSKGVFLIKAAARYERADYTKIESVRVFATEQEYESALREATAAGKRLIATRDGGFPDGIFTASGFEEVDWMRHTPGWENASVPLKEPSPYFPIKRSAHLIFNESVGE